MTAAVVSRSLVTPTVQLRRVLSGSLTSLYGQILARGLSFVTYVLIARILAPADFGRFGALQVTVFLFAAFASLGLGATATRFIAASWNRRPGRSGRLVGILAGFACCAGIIMAVVVVLVAPLVASAGLHDSALASQIAILAGVVFAQSMLGCLQGILTGMERFADSARINVLGAALVIALVPTGGVVAGLDGTSWGFCIAHLLSAAAAWRLVVRALASRNQTTTLARTRRFIRPVMAYGIPIYAAAIANGPFNWICTAILAAQPGGMHQIGVYTAAHQVFMALLYVPMIIASVVQPAATALVASGDRSGLHSLIGWHLTLSTLLVLPPVMLILLVPAWIMGLFGPDFALGSAVLLPLALTVLIASVRSVAGVICRTGPLVHLEMWTSLVGGCLLVAWTWIRRDDGASALGWARCVSMVGEAGIAIPLVVLFLIRRPGRT